VRTAGRIYFRASNRDVWLRVLTPVLTRLPRVKDIFDPATGKPPNPYWRSEVDGRPPRALLRVNHAPFGLSIYRGARSVRRFYALIRARLVAVPDSAVAHVITTEAKVSLSLGRPPLKTPSLGAKLLCAHVSSSSRQWPGFRTPRILRR
jgi:hypothetical protein